MGKEQFMWVVLIIIWRSEIGMSVCTDRTVVPNVPTEEEGSSVCWKLEATLPVREPELYNITSGCTCQGLLHKSASLLSWINGIAS